MQQVSAQSFTEYPGMVPSSDNNKIRIPISLGNIANQFNAVKGQFDTLNTSVNNISASVSNLSTRVTTLSEDLKKVKATVAANHTALEGALEKDRTNVREKFEANKKEFEARDITINAQAAEIRNIQQREVNSNARTATLEAQSQEERARRGVVDNRMQQLEGQVQGINQAQAAVIETKVKIALIEQQNKIQFKLQEEEKKEQENLKQGVLKLAKAVQQFQHTFDQDKKEAKAKGDKEAFTIAQLRAEIAGGIAPAPGDVPEEVQEQVQDDPVIREIENEMAAEKQFRDRADNCIVNYQWPNGKDILKQPVDPANNKCYHEQTTGYQWTILHAAVHHGAIETLKDLIAKGTPGQPSGKGASPFYTYKWDQTPEHRYHEARLMVLKAFGVPKGDELQTLEEQSYALASLQERYKVSRERLVRYLDALNAKMENLSRSHEAFKKMEKKKLQANAKQIAQLREEIAEMKAKKPQEGIKKLKRQRSLVDIKS